MWRRKAGNERVAPRREALREHEPALVVEERDLPQRDRGDHDLETDPVGGVEKVSGSPAKPPEIAGKEPDERMRVGDDAPHP